MSKHIMLDKAACLKIQIYEGRILFMLDSWSKTNSEPTWTVFKPNQHSCTLSLKSRKKKIKKSGSVAWATYFNALRVLWVWKWVYSFHSICIAAGHLSSHLIHEVAFPLLQVRSSNALAGTGRMQSQQKNSSCLTLDFLPLNSNWNTSPVKQPSVHSSHRSDELLNKLNQWHHLMS